MKFEPHGDSVDQAYSQFNKNFIPQRLPDDIISETIKYLNSN